MKVCVIKNEYYHKILGYLFYYEQNNTFYIELTENSDTFGMPIIFKHFYDLGKRTIDGYWSKKWVCERIVPKDRQNISSIIKDNNLKSYDEYKLLLLGKGRCSQDDCMVEEIKEEALPLEIKKRFDKRISDCLNIGSEFLLFFKNGEIRKIDHKKLIKINELMANIVNKQNLISEYEVSLGGYGLEFLNNIFLDSLDLYKASIDTGVVFENIKKYICERVVNTTEATKIMNCSRQNINDLVKRKKIVPIKKTLKGQLFLKNELEQI